MRNKFFIVKHYTNPSPNTNTSMKDYGKLGEKLVDEKATFRNRVNKKDLEEATFIMNLDSGEVVKNRYEFDPESPVDKERAITYYTKEYAKEIASTIAQ